MLFISDATIFKPTILNCDIIPGLFIKKLRSKGPRTDPCGTPCGFLSRNAGTLTVVLFLCPGDTMQTILLPHRKKFKRNFAKSVSDASLNQEKRLPPHYSVMSRFWPGHPTHQCGWRRDLFRTVRRTGEIKMTYLKMFNSHKDIIQDLVERLIR